MPDVSDTAYRSLVLTASLLFLTACGGGGGGSDGGGSTSSVTGTLLDSAVEGVAYSSPSYSGTTDTNGHFQCEPGEAVTFAIGDVPLGTADCRQLVTPVDLAGASQADETPVLNMARLLQSLDEDGNAENGLTIPATAQAALTGASIDFSLDAAQFEQQAAVQTLLSDVAGLAQLRDSCQAELHIKQSLTEAGVLAQDTTLPVCNEVRAAVKVADGLQQAVSDTGTAVTVQAQLVLDNFVLGDDGRAEVYVDGVYETLVETTSVDLALVPGIHQISLKLVDLAGTPVNVAGESAITVDIQDGKAIEVALSEETLYLKPYQVFQLYQSGINFADGEQVTATIAGKEVLLVAQNNVLQGIAPDVDAGTQLLEVELGGQRVSTQVDFLRNASADPKAEIANTISGMKEEISNLILSLDPVSDAAAIQALTEMNQSLDAELTSVAGMTADEAQAYHLFLDANVAGQLLVPRFDEKAYACTEFKKMARAGLKLYLFATLASEFAAGTGGATALAGVPGFLLGAGVTAVPLYFAVDALEEFKAAFSDSINCYYADRDVLETVSDSATRSSYRTRSTAGTINVQDGVQKVFAVKTTYIADDPQYADAIRIFSRALSLLQSLSSYLPESWMAAFTPPADLTLGDRESISDPANYRVSVTSGNAVGVTTTVSGESLVLEFASTTEQDFTFDLLNVPEGITTPYGAHITVDKPIADAGVLEVAEGRSAMGVLTSSDPDAIYELVTAPARGTAIVNQDGTFGYGPFETVAAPATDSFTFKAISRRGVESDPATVSVSILEAPDLVISIDAPKLVFNYGDTSELTVTAVDGFENPVSVGSYTVWHSSIDGELTTFGGVLVVDALSVGEHVITATVSYGGATFSEVVNVTIQPYCQDRTGVSSDGAWTATGSCIEVDGNMYMDGEWTYTMDADGTVWKTVTYSYRNGWLYKHGPYTEYYSDGSLDESGSYFEDRKDGVWLEAEGYATFRITYDNGVMDGPWGRYAYYTATEQWPEMIGSYTNGDKLGVWTFYNVFVSEYDHVNDRPILDYIELDHTETWEYDASLGYGVKVDSVYCYVDCEYIP